MSRRFQFSLKAVMAIVAVTAVATWLVTLGPIGVGLLIAAAYVVIGTMHA